MDLDINVESNCRMIKSTVYFLLKSYTFVKPIKIYFKGNFKFAGNYVRLKDFYILIPIAKRVVRK